MAKSFTRRSVPGAGEEVGTYVFGERINGGSDRTFMRYGTYRHPRRMLKIAHSISAAGVFPSDATGVAAGITNNTIILPVGIPVTGIDYAGLIVTVPLLSQARRILTFDSGTRVATIDRNWTSNPASNTPFMLLVECEGYYGIVGKVEYGSTNPDQYFDLCIGMADVPTDSDARLPIVSFADLINSENFGLTQNLVQLSSHGRGFASEAGGALGCKIAALNFQASTTGSIWVGFC